MTFKIARSKPSILISHKNINSLNNFKIAIAISKKVSKKAVDRNKLRRLLHNYLLKNFNIQNNHKPYWLLVNQSESFFNDKNKPWRNFNILSLNLVFK